jgi:hypothetical protein
VQFAKNQELSKLEQVQNARSLEGQNLIDNINDAVLEVANMTPKDIKTFEDTVNKFMAPI